MKTACLLVCLATLAPANAAAAESPFIGIAREGSQVRVIYSGTLQWASDLRGPWTDLPDAANPHLADSLDARTFYRAKQIESIFARPSVVELAVIGPLQEHFNLAFAGMPDGFFPPLREKPYFPGVVQVDGRDVPTTIKVRGNSSLQECPFPKLKFKVSASNRAGTPFFDAREVDIGTHCAEGGRGSIGRLREQIATYREALAYETMAALGFTTPRVRRAQIEYRDTTPPDGINEVGWTLTRNALLLEDIEVVAERLGGRALEDEELGVLDGANFNEQLVVELWIFHALLGNWDYVVQSNGRGIWNTDVIELPTLELLPVAGDFDLASWVTEEVSLTAPWDYFPEMPPVEREVRYRLDEIQKRVGAESFATAVARFAVKQDELVALVNGAQVDDVGRTNALRHVTAFYEAVAAVTRK